MNLIKLLFFFNLKIYKEKFATYILAKQNFLYIWLVCVFVSVLKVLIYTHMVGANYKTLFSIIII